jgi:soluble lytic murein transglycosylase-like protein
MHRLSFVFLLSLSILGVSNCVWAQTAQSAHPGDSDINRLRTDKSIDRQKKAVAAMSTSIANQELSVQRQQRNSKPDPFFESPRAHIAGASGVGSGAWVNPAPCDSLPVHEIDNLVDTAARSTSVSPDLIRSVMRQESDFRACAVSPKGAIGLMQLLPSTAADMGVEDPFEPEANVMGGARLLKQLMDRYGGDLSLTLSAYNAGTRKVDATMTVPTITETTDYVNRILSRLSSLQKQGASTEIQASTERQTILDSAAETNLLATGAEGGE